MAYTTEDFSARNVSRTRIYNDRTGRLLGVIRDYRLLSVFEPEVGSALAPVKIEGMTKLKRRHLILQGVCETLNGSVAKLRND